MTDRITKPITNMKEYGRKPYLEKDYQNMMEATWHKAQDNSQIVVQSVKKKPYNNTDYQAMEQTGDMPVFTAPTINLPKFDFPFSLPKPNPIPPTVPTEQPGKYPGYVPVNPRILPGGLKYVDSTRTLKNRLRWVQTPSSLSASTRYTVIVANSFYGKENYRNGRLKNDWINIYTPSELSITKASSDAKGLSIVGVTHKYSTSWFVIEASADVSGDFYLNATDGKNVIKKKISVISVDGIIFRRGTPPYTYYKLQDLVAGTETAYTIFTLGDISGFPFPDFGKLTQNIEDNFNVSNYDYTDYFTLTLTDDTLLCSAVYSYVEYYDAGGTSVSYMWASGGIAMGGIPFLPLFYKYTYENFPATSLEIATYKDYTRYFKYTGLTLSTVSTNVSVLRTEETGGPYVLSITGIDVEQHALIDANSYVEVFGFYSGTDTANHYHCSGMFGGSLFSFNLTWSPTVTFGKV